MAPKPESIATEFSWRIQEADTRIFKTRLEARQILLKTMERDVMEKLALPFES